MEESNPARRSSGVYDATYGSPPSLASNASLKGDFKVSVTRHVENRPGTIGHAVAPAGVTTTTPAGVPTGVDAAKPTSAMDDRADSEPVPPPTRARVPFYKRKWFIITQIVLAPIGFAMIFILLWPVVRAVIQLVVNRSTLDIQVATVSGATNNS